MNIKFPDTLEYIRENWENQSDSAVNTVQEGVLELCRILDNRVYGNAQSRSGMSKEMDISSSYSGQYSAMEFISELMFNRNLKLSQITSKSIFLRLAERHYARKYLLGYPLHKLMRAAARMLIKTGEVCIEKSRAENFLQNDTQIFLPSCSRVRCGLPEDYQNNRTQVPNYHAMKLKSSRRTPSIISPADAKSLVVELLKAFGGKARFGDIVEVSFNHVPEFYFKTTSYEECFSKKRTETGHSEGDGRGNEKDFGFTEFQYPEELFELTTKAVALDISGKIWEGSLAISRGVAKKKVSGTAVLCLLWLPGKAIKAEFAKYDSKPLTYFGPAENSRNVVSDLDRLISKNLINLENALHDSPAKREEVKRTVMYIFRVLNRKCSEKGYNSILEKGKGDIK